MASKAIKRRPRSVDTDRRSEEHMETAVSDAMRKPLLGTAPHETQSERYEHRKEPDFLDGKGQQSLHWTHLLSSFIAQSARKIVKVISGFGSLLARLFCCSSTPQNSQTKCSMLIDLSPLQEERLRFLRRRLDVPFDSSSAKHQDALKELWRLAYPTRELPPLKSDLWKEMGWQNSDPATDFRAGGFMSLENLIYFARNYPVSFHRLLHKEDGKRAEWEYPFAVAGVNLTYMLVQMLDLQSGNPTTKTGAHFVQLLEYDDMAFDNLYCVAFQTLDTQWLARRASYMEFNEVLKSTQVQLEQELTIRGISCIQDVPSFGMLKR